MQGVARKRRDDLPARVECCGGYFYYLPGALGRGVGEPQKRIALGRDREGARAKAKAFEALLLAGKPILAPIAPTREHLRQLVYRTRQRAKEIAKPHDIALEYLDSMMTAQGRRCALTDIPFSLDRGAFRAGPWAPSVDRIDCAGGYTRGNVRLVCHVVNVALNEWGDGVLRVVAEAISRKQLGIHESTSP